MITMKEAIKLNQTESKNLKDTMVTLAASISSLQASQAVLTQTVTTDGNTLNTSMIIIIKEYLLISFYNESNQLPM